MKKIKICGVPYKIKEVDVIDESTEGVTLGQIIGSKGIILIKKNQPKEIKKSTTGQCALDIVIWEKRMVSKWK